jgi:hypothetical protein
MIRGVVLLGGMREKATQSGERRFIRRLLCASSSACGVVSGVRVHVVRAHEPLAQEGAVKNAK